MQENYRDTTLRAGHHRVKPYSICFDESFFEFYVIHVVHFSLGEIINRFVNTTPFCGLRLSIPKFWETMQEHDG
jgi:hypothetical protein